MGHYFWRFDLAKILDKLLQGSNDLLRAKASLPLRLDHLLATFCSRGATDPRDKVFGILAMAKEPPLDLVNYNIEFHQAYTQCAKHIIETHRDLLVLEEVGLTEDPRRCTALPCWVPDWRRQLSVDERPHEPSRFSACRQSQWHGGVSETELVAAGFILDKITRIARVSEGPGLEAKAINIYQCRSLAGLDGSKSEPSRYLGGCPRLQAFWLTLFEDTDPFERSYQKYQTIHQECREEIQRYEGIWGTLKAVLKSSRPTYPFPEGMFDNIPEDVQQRLAEFTHSYDSNTGVSDGQDAGYMMQFSLRKLQANRFSCCQKGYIGLAPRTARNGDQVWILQGSRVPVVVRPYSQGNCAILVGVCFVQGIIYREFLVDNTLQPSILRIK